MSGGRRLAIFSLICLFSFSYLDSIDGDTYEFTTPRSPKIEVASPPFFRYSVNFEVKKNAMIGVLESMLYIWVVGPLVSWASGGRLYCTALEPSLVA